METNKNMKDKILNFLKTKWYYIVIGILLITTIGYSSSSKKLVTANEQIAKLEQETETLNKDNEKLKNELEKTNTKNNQLESQLTTSKKELDTANKTLEEKEKELETLTAQTTEPTEPAKTSTTVANNNTTSGSSSVTTGNYVANASTGKFHYASCSSVSRMNESNKVYFSDRESAAAIYTPCKRCHP